MRDSQNNRVRPNFELLEDRTTPASVTVTTLTDVSDGDTTSVANLKASPGPDGAISLREAITAINTSTDLNNQITFGGDNAVDGDINLTSELNVSKNLTITGPGSGPALDVRILGTLGQVDPFVAGKRVFTVTGARHSSSNAWW
jgi:hypothetical protein